MSNRLGARISAAAAMVVLGVSTPAEADVADGRSLVYAARPKASSPRACSPRVPVCVQGPARPAAATLDAFERAWVTLTKTLELPAPDVDPFTLAYDVFLVDGATLGGEIGVTRIEARDVRARYDRTRSFTEVDARVSAGCALDTLAAREVARAILARVSPATDEGSARAQTSYYASLAVPCASAFAHDAIAAFQAHPDRALPDASSPLAADGAALFWSRLDWAYGRFPGGIVLGTWALSPTITPLGARTWKNEPDGYDVLRKSFEGMLFTKSDLGDLFVDFGVARAFFGSADDGIHQPETRIFGDAARVPLDWDLPWPKTPRRVAPRAPIAPSGASYVMIRREGARPDARLRIEITWEEHALFRWNVVKLDARGRELGRIPIAARERATDAQITMTDFGGADRVLLVGVNTGDPAYGFDPDDAIWEPHSWLVTVAEE